MAFTVFKGSSPQGIWGSGATGEQLSVTNLAAGAPTIPAGSTGMLLTAADATSELLWVHVAAGAQGTGMRLGAAQGPQSIYIGLNPLDLPSITIHPEGATTSVVNVTYFTG